MNPGTPARRTLLQQTSGRVLSTKQVVAKQFSAGYLLYQGQSHERSVSRRVRLSNFMLETFNNGIMRAREVTNSGGAWQSFVFQASKFDFGRQKCLVIEILRAKKVTLFVDPWEFSFV
jgi:hypothetical protein